MKILHIGQMIGGLDVYIRNSIVHIEGPFEFVIVHGLDDKNEPVKKNGNPVREYRVSLYRKLNPIRDLKCLLQIIRIVRVHFKKWRNLKLLFIPYLTLYLLLSGKNLVPLYLKSK
jgi:hypothetical protein